VWFTSVAWPSPPRWCSTIVAWAPAATSTITRECTAASSRAVSAECTISNGAATRPVTRTCSPSTNSARLSSAQRSDSVSPIDPSRAASDAGSRSIDARRLSIHSAGSPVRAGAAGSGRPFTIALGAAQMPASQDARVGERTAGDRAQFLVAPAIVARTRQAEREEPSHRLGARRGDPVPGSRVPRGLERPQGRVLVPGGAHATRSSRSQS
jgi:hypothetical protein